MSDAWVVISGTRRAMREMADGTIEVKIHIDPAHRKAFMEHFGQIDMPVAIAPLVADFEQRETEKPKGGELAKLAGMLCNDPEFQRFIDAPDSDQAAEKIRKLCRVQSRVEFDMDPGAAAEFHKMIRGPWLRYRASRGLK